MKPIYNIGGNFLNLLSKLITGFLLALEQGRNLLKYNNVNYLGKYLFKNIFQNGHMLLITFTKYYKDE